MKKSVHSGIYTDPSVNITFSCKIDFEDKGLRIHDLENLGRDSFWPLDKIWTDTVHTNTMCILLNGDDIHTAKVVKIYAKNIHRVLVKRYPKESFVQNTANSYITLSRVASIVTSLLVLSAVVYFLILPWAAEYAANYFPLAAEEKLGDYYVKGFSINNKEDTERTALLQEFYDNLAWEKDYDCKIIVLRSTTINAVALPGGRIIVFSALLDSLGTYEELAALLAHEYSHVKMKHSVKSLCRSLAHSIFLALLTGDTNSVFAVLTRNADLLHSLSYSRRMERAADESAVRLMEQAGIHPRGMQHLLERLNSLSTWKLQEEYDLISTHPALEKRIREVRRSLPSDYLPAKDREEKAEEIWLKLMNHPRK
jgi:predicted Zn-dependent protease